MTADPAPATTTEALLLEAVRHGLAGDDHLVRQLATRLFNQPPGELSGHDGFRDRLAQLLSEAGASRPRVTERPLAATPRDAESSLPLVRIEPPVSPLPPLLNREEDVALDGFMREHKEANRLARAGLAPSGSLLLIGPPGVGKTMTARFIAASLDLPLVILDLVTVMSSYLGRTGQNLQRSIDYARLTPCVLLLDEFDAIAKHRGDSGDVGELKRVVNVLLLELERQPSESILVAATNHPELLDRAIQRRFERIVRLDLPTPDTRRSILERSLLAAGADVDHELLDLWVAATGGASGSDLVRLSRSALRRSVLDGRPLEAAITTELPGRADGGEER